MGKTIRTVLELGQQNKMVSVEEQNKCVACVCVCVGGGERVKG